MSEAMVGFLYRDHCGSLADSMETEQRFGSFEELEEHVHGLEGMCGDEKITTEPYVFDKRNGWDTHIVRANGNAVGFTHRQPTKGDENE